MVMTDASKESMVELLTEYANNLNKTLGSHLKDYQLNYQEREVLIRELLELAGDLMQDSIIIRLIWMTRIDCLWHILWIILNSWNMGLVFTVHG